MLLNKAVGALNNKLLQGGVNFIKEAAQNKAGKMARNELNGTLVMEQEARNGASNALLELGLMYSLGRDVERDLVMAHKWFNLAALRGNKCARTYRIEIASELSIDEVAVAQRLARDWLMTVH
jgi:TPR repeat protein